MAERCTICDQAILLRPTERDTCAGCRMRGGSPVPIETTSETTAATTLPPDVRAALFCERQDCDSAVLPLEETDWNRPPPRTREQRRTDGLRTECWKHHCESRDMSVDEHVFHPGRPVEQAG